MNHVDNTSAYILLLLMITLLIENGYAQDADEDIVTYTVIAPDEVQSGRAFNVDILFNVQPDWYIYAPTGKNAALGMIETKLILRLPEGISKKGKPSFPKAIRKNGHEVYEGNSITMSQALLVSSSIKPGKYEIRGKVIYQTCSSEICLPPVTEEIIAIVIVK